MKFTLFLLIFMLLLTNVFAYCRWEGTSPWCGYNSDSLCPNGSEPYCYADSEYGARSRCGDANIAESFGSACAVGKKICCN